MDYVIASVAVTDEIHFPDRMVVNQLAGGAGIYALSGIKIWNDSVLIVTGVGKDYEKCFGSWYKKNGISMEGLMAKEDKTPHTVIRYFKDGQRKEHSLYGADHFLKVEVTPEELKPYFGSAKGIYIFKNSETAFWEKILQYRQESDTKIMWEIGSDATVNNNVDTVRRIASQVDIFSINKAEALSLLGVKRVEDAVREFQSWGVPLVFFRQGALGAYMITKQEAILAESVKGVQVVDATGGGNSSSGAVLYGFCEHKTPLTAGLMGSVSAAICIGQYGVPKEINQDLRNRANHMLKNLLNGYENKQL